MLRVVFVLRSTEIHPVFCGLLSLVKQQLLGARCIRSSLFSSLAFSSMLFSSPSLLLRLMSMRGCHRTPRSMERVSKFRRSSPGMDPHAKTITCHACRTIFALTLKHRGRCASLLLIACILSSVVVSESLPDYLWQKRPRSCSKLRRIDSERIPTGSNKMVLWAPVRGSIETTVQFEVKAHRFRTNSNGLNPDDAPGASAGSSTWITANTVLFQVEAHRFGTNSNGLNPYGALGATSSSSSTSDNSRSTGHRSRGSNRSRGSGNSSSTSSSSSNSGSSGQCSGSSNRNSSSGHASSSDDSSSTSDCSSSSSSSVVVHRCSCELAGCEEGPKVAIFLDR